VPQQQRGKQISGLVKQLIECRDDDRFNLLQADLKNVLDRERISISKGTLSERYISGETSLHIHNRLRLRGNSRLNFCAMLEASPGNRNKASMQPHNFLLTNLSIGQIKVSVFVDIREMGKPSQDFRRAGTVIRLNTLDECKRRFGNPRKNLGEVVVGQGKLAGNGGIASHRNMRQQRKFTPLLPVRGELDSGRIQLDEIECQVIQGRTELIERLASQNCDVGRRRFLDVYCFFAVRIRDDFARLTAGISANALFNSVDVLRCPDEFEVR
jgi:hypothetical protein